MNPYSGDDDLELWAVFSDSDPIFSDLQENPYPSSSDSTWTASAPGRVTTLTDDPTRPSLGLKRKPDFESTKPSSKRLKTGEKLTLVATTAQKLQGTGPFVIAGFGSPDQEIFSTVDGLSTGVMWEIARLASMGRLPDVYLEDLNRLKGSNSTAAPQAAGILLNESDRQIKHDLALSLERKAQDPWWELDLEENALSSNPHAGLGNYSEYPQGYYGGKVCFAGSIEVGAESRNSVKVVLERLRIPTKTFHSNVEGLRDFFQRPFVLFDSVFRSFYAKDGTVLLFKTRERYKHGVIETIDSASSLTLFEFLDQFNPLNLNSKQLLCKWASRFALGLSNSVPGPILSVAQADEYDDILSVSQSNMTDGCGLSNPAFNLKLRRDFKLESTPCAVQIRHGGRKGMLLLSPESCEDVEPRVAFRKPSQIKINYSDEAKEHRANATMDILRFSRTKTPARISAEVIINLEHNGVPAEVFIAMQDEYLASGVEGLLLWAKEGPGGGNDTPDDMVRLWDEVERAEGVSISRRIRQVGGEARFRGLSSRYADAAPDDDEEESDKFDKATQERSTAWWPDYVSGQPSSLAETAMALLDAGFIPHALPVLRDKIKQVVKTKIKYRAAHFNYEIAQSASAFVVPDFWNVLQEDEIHFKSSRREFQVADGPETDIVLGPVLMTRNPCKVPTDVRKLRAVKHPVLHDLVDVIVCSVKGNRRLLDFLAGGDYDGDTAIVIWESKVVDPFVNADEKYSNEPTDGNDCFTRDQTTVEKFIMDNARNPPEVKAHKLQAYLLGSLRDPSAVGQYSSLHDNAVIRKGYAHPETVALAYKFCKILDSPKTGYTIKPAVRSADHKSHKHPRGAGWKERQKKEKGGQFSDTSNANPLIRKVDGTDPMVCRPFIMDVLVAAADEQEARWLAEVQRLFLPFETSPEVLDKDLTEPWETFAAFAAKQKTEGDTRPSEDLSLIVEHVQGVYEQHRKNIKTYDHSGKSNTFTGSKIEVRQDALRKLSREFAASPSTDQLGTFFDSALIGRLRASYAYLYDHLQYKGHGRPGWSRFPWDMAMGELCRIKAAALGTNKAVTTHFYERFKLVSQKRA